MYQKTSERFLLNVENLRQLEKMKNTHSKYQELRHKVSTGCMIATDWKSVIVGWNYFNKWCDGRKLNWQFLRLKPNKTSNLAPRLSSWALWLHLRTMIRYTWRKCKLQVLTEKIAHKSYGRLTTFFKSQNLPRPRISHLQALKSNNYNNHRLPKHQT
jgi:hypothetical protein